MDTFSANSLKILDKDPEMFRLKYAEGLFLNPDNSNAKAGQNLHSFLCFYLKGFDMGKIEASFSKKDREFLDKIKEFDAVKTLKDAKHKDIEQPFLIKCDNFKTASAVQNKPETLREFYLTGRFDAVLRLGDRVEIYDWKMVNIPKSPETDIQTIVYLYAASKLYRDCAAESISLTYVSLSKNENATVCFDSKFDYFAKISSIVEKAKI